MIYPAPLSPWPEDPALALLYRLRLEGDYQGEPGPEMRQNLQRLLDEGLIRAEEDASWLQEGEKRYVPTLRGLCRVSHAEARLGPLAMRIVASRVGLRSGLVSAYRCFGVGYIVDLMRACERDAVLRPLCAVAAQAIALGLGPEAWVPVDGLEGGKVGLSYAAAGLTAWMRSGQDDMDVHTAAWLDPLWRWVYERRLTADFLDAWRWVSGFDDCGQQRPCPALPQGFSSTPMAWPSQAGVG